VEENTPSEDAARKAGSVESLLPATLAMLYRLFGSRHCSEKYIKESQLFLCAAGHIKKRRY
jgi:hypothetical protein